MVVMHISWLGSTGLKIQTKPAHDDVVVTIDPYKQEKGAFPRSLTPDIALFTHGEKESITLSGTPFTLSAPGEVETKNVLITAVQGHDAKHVLIRIDTEQMSLAHLGSTNKQLTDEQLEVVGDVDILCIPVGGGDNYDAEQAVKAVNSVEPRIVIPIAHKSDNEPSAEPVTNFLKSIGSAENKPETKVIIKKRDLPQEETKVVVLSKE